MNVVSLFSGVGGFDLGLEQAGMKTIYQCEWDKHATNILQRHWPDVPKWGDITTLTAQEILRHGQNPDVIAWGSPCQDLSVAGKRAGLEGERSGLFHEGMRIIKELRKETNNAYPRISIWENVAGALSSNRGADFGVILDEMAQAGAMVIEWAVLDAQFFGIPQRRRRIFVVAIFDPAIARNCPNPLLPVAESVRRNGTQDGYITFYTSQGRQDKYRKSVVSALKTAGTSCITGSEIPPRKFTPLECERLMGWQDDHTRWNPDGTEQADTHRYKQCGNGVASPVARWIAQHILNIPKDPAQ
jgi:DNA (cytosine-5)-methyltransferase 1